MLPTRAKWLFVFGKVNGSACGQRAGEVPVGYSVKEGPWINDTFVPELPSTLMKYCNIPVCVACPQFMYHALS